MRCALLLLLIPACRHGASAPAEPSCANVAEHVYGMLPQDDHGKSVRDVFVTRCSKDDWSPDTRTCMLDVKTLHDGHHCKDHLSPDQRTGLEVDLEGIEKRRAAQLPPECEKYRLAIEKFAACDKMPAASRDAMKQGFDAMAQSWGKFSTMSPEDRRTVINSCRIASDAVDQAGKAICGW